MNIRDQLTSRQVSEDLALGQGVIVTARWILVLAGLVFTLWDPSGIGTLRVQLLVLFVLAIANFYLHAQLLLRRPAVDAVAYAASAADIAVISLLVYVGDGFGSQLYIFYFPALLALAVAFPTEMTVTYTALAATLYGLISLEGIYPASGDQTLVLLTRLLMLVAVAACGNLSWRLERRRRAATQLEDALSASAAQPEVARIQALNQPA